MINGGDLQCKVLFFEYGLMPDGAGGFLPNGPKLVKLQTMASIRQIKASRTAENLQESINTVYEIKLRQRAGFNPKSDYLVEWDGKICEITGISEDVVKKGLGFWLITVVTNPLLKVPVDIEVIVEDPYTQPEFLASESQEPYTVAQYNAS